MRYIGSKTLLLEKIQNVIQKNVDKEADTFFDAFSGTATVGKYFKKDYTVFSNDLLYFSYVLQYGHIKINTKPNFEHLQNIDIPCPLEYFNTLNITHDMITQTAFIYENYSPTSTNERMYLSNTNALKIDFIRQTLNSWLGDRLINTDEYYYLLAVLLEAIPYVSNISGVYGAYLKHWDKRALNDLVLKDIELNDNAKENKIFNEDINILVEGVSGDILYIDPPYNARQYLPNYHLLETVAKYDNPKIYGKTGVRPYDDEKSSYCQKGNVLDAFDGLIQKAQFKNILVSYSTDGMMRVDAIRDVLLKYGIAQSYKLYTFDYRKYRSKNEHKKKELIFFIKKDVENVSLIGTTHKVIQTSKGDKYHLKNKYLDLKEQVTIRGNSMELLQSKSLI